MFSSIYHQITTIIFWSISTSFKTVNIIERGERERGREEREEREEREGSERG